MNPDNPMNPREALEPSLTALLLGELPEDQAQLVRQAIANDPELARTYERLKNTATLLRETEVSPVRNPPDQPKLSGRRREQLLQAFKTVQPEEFQRPRRLTVSALAVLAACIVLSALLVIALLPALARKKNQSFAQLGESEVAFRRRYTQYGENTAPRATAPSSTGDALTPGERRLYAAQPAPAAGPAQTAAGTPFQQAIVLPAEGKSRENLSLADGKLDAASAPHWAYSINPQVSEPGLTSAGTVIVNGAGGLGGGALAAPESIPVLGDKPEIGRLFQTENKVSQDGLDENRLTFDKLVVNETADVLGKQLQSPAPSRAKEKLDDRLGQPEAAQKSDLAAKDSFDIFAETDVNRKAALVQKIEPPKEVMREELPALRSELRDDRGSVDVKLGQKAQIEQQDKTKKVELLVRRSLAETDQEVAVNKERVQTRSKFAPTAGRGELSDLAVTKPALPAPVPQPEISTKENAFSTFSLNVSDVSFRLATAALEQGKLPEPESIRTEEFINAFDYRDPEPAPGQPVAFAWDRARSPFAQNRDLLRFSIKTGAAGRAAGRALNLVLLVDNSGSMERADRVQIIHEALRILATQLQPGDTLSVVTFARTARLWVDGVSGDQAGRIADELSALSPEGGTNLEEAMNLAYQTAGRHYLANGINRVVLMTDGAANLGDTNPEILKQKVETHRKQGVAFDCFGIGWEGYNDDLLEVLTRNGDGRYGFLNTPAEAATEFAAQLAGALQVAASDVKVQVEFNPSRVTAFRQIGYARHQLTKEQFRDNTVDAAEIGAAEAGNALYAIETNPQGTGPIATVRVRYKTPGGSDYHEHEWVVPYSGNAAEFEQATPALRLAGTAAGFAEWLASSPYAAEVTPGRLPAYLNDLPSIYGADPRPQRLAWMIGQAAAISGK